MKRERKNGILTNNTVRNLKNGRTTDKESELRNLKKKFQMCRYCNRRKDHIAMYFYLETCRGHGISRQKNTTRLLENHYY